MQSANFLGGVALKELHGLNHGQGRGYRSQNMPMVREHGEGMHLDLRAAQSEDENTEDKLIEELARSQEKATLDAATAEVDEGMGRDVA